MLKGVKAAIWKNPGEGKYSNICRSQMIGDEAEIFIWISPLRGILGGSEEGLPTGLQDICVEKVFRAASYRWPFSRL